MRISIWTTILVLPLATVAVPASNSLSIDPPNQSFGYSSDEIFGGGSYLGVDTRDVTPDRLDALKLKEEHGVEVTMVDQDAPAGKAGIKEQDVILGINGTPIESVEQLRRVIHEIPAGRIVTLSLSRSGQPMTLKAQLADRKKAYSYSYGTDAKSFKFTVPEIPPIPPIPDFDPPVSVVYVHSSMRSGLMVENLTPQLGDFLGVKNGQGVLVRSVEKGSRADKAGFRAGDVIVKVNGQSVNDAGDFSHALRSRKDNTASVNIVRDKKEQTITLTLPANPQTGEILNESLEIPEMDAYTSAALSEVSVQIQKIKPQLERAAQEARGAADSIKPEIERVMRETRLQSGEMQKQMQELKRQLREREREMKRTIKDRADI